MREIEEKNIEGGRWFQRKNDRGEISGVLISSISGRKLLLEHFQVNKKERNKGVGSSLMGAAFDWGKKNGALEIVGEFVPEGRGGQDEKVAREFYKKHGIEIDEKGNLRGRIK